MYLLPIRFASSEVSLTFLWNSEYYITFKERRRFGNRKIITSVGRIVKALPSSSVHYREIISRFSLNINHSKNKWKKSYVDIRGVSKKFGEWYQKTNKTEDTNKLTLLAFKVIAILHNTLLATFIKLLETVSKGLFRNRSQNG
jgi:hypothetical protein